METLVQEDPAEQEAVSIVAEMDLPVGQQTYRRRVLAPSPDRGPGFLLVSTTPVSAAHFV
jgi:hypothetical protein